MTRSRPGVVPIALIVLVFATAVAAVCQGLRGRSFGPFLYAGIALVGCVAIDLAGGVPWVIGKALAIASPAVLFAGAGRRGDALGLATARPGWP